MSTQLCLVQLWRGVLAQPGLYLTQLRGFTPPLPPLFTVLKNSKARGFSDPSLFYRFSYRFSFTVLAESPEATPHVAMAMPQPRFWGCVFGVVFLKKLCAQNF